MKTRLLIVHLLVVIRSFSQELDYCNYFSVKFSEVEYDGQKFKSCEPVIIENKNDRASQFFKKHRYRFDYILFKNIDEYKAIGNYFPDSVKIQSEFCETVMRSAKIHRYFSCLTPKDIAGWKAEKDTFTLNELMLVASRFFYCDDVNRTDTTIQSHVCIGINGQKEIVPTRDYTLLEAFSGEAIFHYLDKKREPLFYRQFYLFKRKATKENAGEFTDFDSYLLKIRGLCYDQMQHNTELKEKLLKYYYRNRDNLNIEILI